MTIEADLGTVIDLACYTEDRSHGEQRALLTTALRLDMARGAFVITNEHPERPVYVARVQQTYAPSAGKLVALTSDQQKQYDGLVARWELCADCTKPMGAHPLTGCPR